MADVVRGFLFPAYLQWTHRVYWNLVANPFTAVPAVGAFPVYAMLVSIFESAMLGNVLGNAPLDPSRAHFRRVFIEADAEYYRQLQASGITVEQLIRAYEAELRR